MKDWKEKIRKVEYHLKLTKLIPLGIGAIILVVLGGCQGTTPLQASVYPPVQLFDKWTSVRGLRTGLVLSGNKDVKGLDIGLGVGGVEGGMVGLQANALANVSSENMTGVQIGILNGGESVRGIQVAGLYNETEDMTSGLQLAGLINNTEQIGGLQLSGLFSRCKRDAQGVQIGLIANHTDGKLEGVQVGLINFADYHEKGVQVGLLNFTDDACFPILNIPGAKKGIHIGAGPNY